MNWKQQLLRWWAGANRAGLTGGAVAVKAWLAAAAASAAGLGVPALSLKQAGYVFGFAFAVDFVSYLAANPMPEPEEREASERGSVERGSVSPVLPQALPDPSPFSSDRNAPFVNPATSETARNPVPPVTTS